MSKIKRRKRLRKRAIRKEKRLQECSYDMHQVYLCERKKELRKFAKEQGIDELDMDYSIRALGWVRKPLVLVRGRPITVEQAKELITGEEPLFGDGRNSECWCFDPRTERGVLENIFYRSGFGWLSTWVYSDGTIGGNLMSVKWPEWDEMILPYMHLAEKYPFLDMVVSYTSYNESCCHTCYHYSENGIDRELIQEMWKWDCKCKDCQRYLDKIDRYSRRNPNYKYNRYPADFEELYFNLWFVEHVRSDVGDSVKLTIWVHDGRTDILFDSAAVDKFKQYNELYCAPEYAFMFATGLYESHRTCICSKTFVEDCFEYIGKPRSLCDEYVEKGFISPFNENAVVVTKEWVTQQYNAFIEPMKNTGLL